MKNKIILIILLGLFIFPFVNGLHSDYEGEVPVFIGEYLDTNGNQTGTYDAIGDYSAGVDFYIQPPSDKVYRITRLLISLGDTTINNADQYGGIAQLNNGTQFITKINGTESFIDGDRGSTFISNGYFQMLMYDFNCDFASLGSGEDFCTGRWTFDKSGTVIRLDGNKNDTLIVRLRDDMTGLIHQRFMVQGYEERTQNTTVEAVNMLGISLILMFVLSIYLLMAINWDFTLFDTEGKTDNKNNIIKSGLIWLLVWLIPLAVQFSIELGETVGASTDMITLLETLYTSTIWIGYTITVYFMIYFGYNVLLFMGNVTKSRKK